MRSDLAKCTTEHERARGYGKIKYGGKVSIDPDPDHDYPNEFGGFRSSARRRHTRNKTEYKEFTDFLSPLRGAIRKNVGRKWDAVFSEFCRVLDRRSLSGYHIWTHLIQEVQTKTFLENGVVMEQLPYWGSRAVDGFYVHPMTGILHAISFLFALRLAIITCSTLPRTSEWVMCLIRNQRPSIFW